MSKRFYISTPKLYESHEGKTLSIITVIRSKQQKDGKLHSFDYQSIWLVHGWPAKTIDCESTELATARLLHSVLHRVGHNGHLDDHNEAVQNIYFFMVQTAGMTVE